MPFSKAYFATRAEADAAQLTAIANVEAIYAVANSLDPIVAAGTVGGSATPTARFEYVSAEPAPAGALPTGAADMRKVTVRVTTADGRQALTTIWMTAGDAAGLSAAGGGEYHAVGAPLEWKTSVQREPDGRYSVTLYSANGV